MKLFFFAIAALSVGSIAFAGPAKVSAKGNVVTVSAGDYEVGTKVIHVAKAAKFTVEPAGDVGGQESHQLVLDKPLAWLKGTHIDQVKAGGVPLADCLDPASVHLTLGGKELTKDKDYLFDPKWAGFSRVEGGAISADAFVTIDFKLSQERIDAIEVDADGIAHLHRGEATLTCAKPPEVAAGGVVIANIFMPYRAAGVEADFSDCGTGDAGT